MPPQSRRGLRLLALLARGELTVGEICEIVDQSQPRISRHLKVLSERRSAGSLPRTELGLLPRAATGAGRETVRQLLDLVSGDDDVLRRDRRRLEDVVAERGRRHPRSATAAALTDCRSVDRILLAELGAEPIGALLDVGTGSRSSAELAGAARRLVR